MIASCWKQISTPIPFPEKKKKAKAFFACLVGWLFFSLSKGGRSKIICYILPSMVKGSTRCSCTLLVLSETISIPTFYLTSHLSSASHAVVEQWRPSCDLQWRLLCCLLLFLTTAFCSQLQSCARVCVAQCGHCFWASHITSLGTGANWANHFMIPPWKIITSAVSILHLRLVFPCSKRGGCAWVVSKAFPSLPLQKPGAVSAVHGIQGSSVFLEVFEGLPQQNSPSHGWDQEKPQGKKLF